MGFYLEKPVTEKKSTDEEGKQVKCGISSMQGWRKTQEDAHNCCIDFDKDASLFAVYDGHNGPVVSMLCSQLLPDFIKNIESYKTGDIKQALIDAFLGFDEILKTLKVNKIKKKKKKKNTYKYKPAYNSGCTAVVAILKGNELYVANAGDSRCVLSRKGKAIELSLDHKPEDQIEMDRIIKAGGIITDEGRINGGLNLSRALGDHVYKKKKKLPPQEQMISPLPDVKSVTIDRKKDEFMVLACDGIWECMSSQEVIDFVRCGLYFTDKNRSTICEELFDNCIGPDDDDSDNSDNSDDSEDDGYAVGYDNMTAIIVQFN